MYCLLTLNFILPETLAWFESQFPNYNKSFIENIVSLPFGMYIKRFLKYERHNECYASHFYHDFIGRAHCHQQCDISELVDQALNFKITTALDNFGASYSSANPTTFQPCVRDFQTSNQLRKKKSNRLL